MLDAYDGSMPHPRSKSAFLNDRGILVCTDDEGAGPRPSDCLYSFNSLGYRGDEFDPAARLKIFVSGCSYTFGLGVEHDRIWPSLLKKRLAERRGVPLDHVNLQNFSQVGASNGYIARTIIRQCDRVRPDLAIIAFTHCERTEYLAPGITRSLGLWDLDTPEASWAPAAMRYFNLHNTESASLELLKNVLLVQWAMTCRGIPYRLLWMNRSGLDRPLIRDLEPLRPLQEMLDLARLSACSLLAPGILVDSNPVDRHPGPRSHANLAARVVEELDLSAPKATSLPDSPMSEPPLPPPTGQGAAKRILVLGGAAPAPVGGVPACGDNRCICRQQDSLHGFLAAPNGPPLAANGSNDRIVRTLLTECHRQRPDFVFVSFFDSRSCEHFLGETLVELNGASAEIPTPEAEALAEAYRHYVTDELQELNALRNILLAQEFLQARRIPFIFSIPPALGWREMNATGKHPVLRKQASLLRSTSLCNRRAREGAAIDDRDDALPPRRPTVEITWAFMKRLKAKLRKSRTEDPNIYPLW